MRKINYVKGKDLYKVAVIEGKCIQVTVCGMWNPVLLNENFPDTAIKGF